MVNTFLIIYVMMQYGNNTSEGNERTLYINNEEEYLVFADSVSEENNYDHWDIVICQDLDFSDYENLPVIGESKDGEAIKFLGNIEGNGHRISGYHVSNPDGMAGLFANFSGMIKNLRIEDSSFYGSISGAVTAITADGYDASILNCYVDAEVDGNLSGTIAGQFGGNLKNCVSSADALGEFRYGHVENCYLIGEENIEALNNNLYYLSGSYDDSSFCVWESTEDGILSKEKKELLDTLAAKLIVGEREFDIEAFYSDNDAQWYVVVPEAYYDQELFMEARTNTGKCERFKRNAGEAAFLYTCGEQHYLINFVATDRLDSLYFTLGNQKDLESIHANKEEKKTGILTLIDANGKIEDITVKGLWGHGNDSWRAAKKSYNLEFDGDINLLNMGANEDFVLLAGYRGNSLMSYVTTAELVKHTGFAYAPEYRLVNLYVADKYLGVYFLTEKIELDDNRIEISNVYENTKKLNPGNLDEFEYCMYLDEETEKKRYYYDIPENPQDITGGYLLEMDISDYGEMVSRFITRGRRNKITMKRATYSTEDQVNYIAEYWQGFEDALYSDSGYNSLGKRYTEYIDLESFAMQWLMYELSQEGSMRSSIYFYKESDISGDGLLHAVYPWDMERSYYNLNELEVFPSINSKSEYWGKFYRHEDFQKAVSKVWEEKFIPAIEQVVSPKSAERNLAWYEANLQKSSWIENARWSTCNMMDKSQLIRDILNFRKGVISQGLN